MNDSGEKTQHHHATAVYHPPPVIDNTCSNPNVEKFTSKLILASLLWRNLLPKRFANTTSVSPLCRQTLPHELRPRPAEHKGAQRSDRGERLFRAANGDWGKVGETGSRPTDSVQQWHRHVWRPFPLLSGAEHTGELTEQKWNPLKRMLLTQNYRFYGFLQQCMQDLMDGYLPSELQERFPDGIPFEVCDCLQADV